MPGRMPGEEESILSQLQLHRVAELHRVVEQRRTRLEGLESERDRDRERERDRPTLYRAALRHLSGGASRYVPTSNLERDLYPLDDVPAETDAEPPFDLSFADQGWELAPEVTWNAGMYLSHRMCPQKAQCHEKKLCFS